MPIKWDELRINYCGTPHRSRCCLVLALGPARTLKLHILVGWRNAPGECALDSEYLSRKSCTETSFWLGHPDLRIHSRWRSKLSIELRQLVFNQSAQEIPISVSARWRIGITSAWAFN